MEREREAKKRGAAPSLSDLLIGEVRAGPGK